MPRIEITYDANTKRASKNIKNLNRNVDGTFKSSGKASGSIKGMWKTFAAGHLAAAAAIKGLRHINDFFKNSHTLATDFNESQSKLNTIFRDASGTVKDLAKNYGLSNKAAVEMVGNTGDLLTGLNMNEKKALELSKRTQQLAVDLASFTNYSGGAKGASDALTKAMLGEREMLKGLGIVIQESMVKERLRAKGLEKLTGIAMKEAQAEATLELALEQSKNAVGDYARTSGSLANQKKLLTARFEDFQVAIGNTINESGILQQGIELLINTLTDPEFVAGSKALLKTILDGFKSIVSGVKTVIKTIKQYLPMLDKVFEGWEKISALATDKWGRALDAETAGIIRQSDQFKKYDTILQKFRIEVGLTRKQAIQMGKDFKKSGSETSKSAWIMNQIVRGKYGEKLRDQMLSFRKGARKAEEAQRKTSKEIKKSVPVIKKKIKTDKEERKEIEAKINAIAAEAKRRGKLNQYLDKSLLGIADDFLKAQKSGEKFNKEIVKNNENFTEQLSKLEMIKRGFDAVGNVLDVIGVKSGSVAHDLLDLGNSTVNFLDSLDDPGLISKFTTGLQLLGSVAKSLAKWFQGDGPGEAMARDIRKGINITDDLEEKLRELEKETKDMHFAASLMFEDIVNGSEVTVENFDDFAIQLRSMLSDFDRGKLTAGEFNKEMGEGFDALIQKAKELGTEGSASLIALFDDLKGRGLEVTKINEYMISQFKSGVDGLAQYAEAGGQNVKAYSSAIFQSLQQQGVGLLEIVKIMGSNLPESWAKWAEEHKNLIGQIEGSKKMLEAFGNTGELSNELFSKFQTEAKGYYDQLIKSGRTSEESMKILAPMLAKQIWYAKQQGLELDANTKKMIEKAKKQGINLDALIPKEDKMLAVFEKMSDTLDGIAKAFGVQIPRGLEAMDRKMNTTFVNGINKAHKLGNKLSAISWNGPAGNIPKIKGFQHGGSFVTNRPTLMDIGGQRIATSEHHVPEKVTIEPLNRRGGGQNINQNFNINLNVSGVETQGMDIEQFGAYMNRAMEYNIDAVVEKAAKKMQRYMN